MPRIGCLGIALLAIGLLVVGGLFLGVPKPVMHLPPNDILKADTPAHYWEGDVELEIHPHADEVDQGEVYHFHASASDKDNLPDSPVYEWAFWNGEEELARLTGSEVEYEFAEGGEYTVQVYLWEEAVGHGEPYARAMSHEVEESTFPITNTMITSWISVIILVSLVYFGMRKRSLVPTGLQNVVEAALEWVYNFVENAAGRENGRRFFPVVATIFFFVITNAWLALVPIFNVIGWGHSSAYETAFFGSQDGFMVSTPLFRSANTDVNLPLALAIMSGVFVEFWGITSLGLGHYIAKFIKMGPVLRGARDLFRGQVMPLLVAVIEAFVGFIELICEVMRIVSFTFRLFGNMTAGEILLMMMAFLIPLLAAVPFYGLELLVGFIQALVFGGLTLGFAMIAVAPHEEEEEH